MVLDARTDLTAFAEHNDLRYSPPGDSMTLSTTSTTSLRRSQAGDTAGGCDTIPGGPHRRSRSASGDDHRRMDLIDLDEPTQRIVHITRNEPNSDGSTRPTSGCRRPVSDDRRPAGDEHPDLANRAVRGVRPPSRVRRRLTYPAAARPTRYGRSHAVAAGQRPADVIFTNGAATSRSGTTRASVTGPRLVAGATERHDRYGLPAAIAAGLPPRRTVVCFAGDGDLK